MKNSGVIALVISVVLSIYVLVAKNFNSEAKKTGVVQMEKLVYEFKGMKEAGKKYQIKLTSWQSQSDSLETRLNELYDEIKMDSINRNAGKLARDLKKFEYFKYSYLEYAKRMEEKSKEEDRQMTLGVINQVNEYIKMYAEKEGFDIIFCNGQAPSVSYCKTQLDVTQKVLEFSNLKYDGVN
ncbi:hypothetical protein CNR22_00130 [Sphingobacteriaceae bacterium]|nr:hypothetical protein CNR22_00130 [Sphingobacteriaceae bacterium]